MERGGGGWGWGGSSFCPEGGCGEGRVGGGGGGGGRGRRGRYPRKRDFIVSEHGHLAPIRRLHTLCMQTSK